MNWKEKWNETDEIETCPVCNHTKVVKRARGITRQNIGRLFHSKWTADETIITFLLIMILVMAIFYKIDIRGARDFIKDFNENPEKYCEGYYLRNNTYVMQNAEEIYNNSSAS